MQAKRGARRDFLFTQAIVPQSISSKYEAKIKNMGNAGRNGGEEVVHRSPLDIIDEIAALDAESAKVLTKIRVLL